MDNNLKKSNSSWIWQNLMACKSKFMKGACYKVTRDYTLRIMDNPWIPEETTMKPPRDIVLPHHFTHLCQLMMPDGNCWNLDMVNRIFA